MCGVIGFSQQCADEESVEMIERLFLESMVRGKHATGLAWVKNGVVCGMTYTGPADRNINKDLIREMIDDDGSISMIGHTRYSTSDLRYHQPLWDADAQLAIVHNGVVSQEPVSTWKYKTKTSNDSELILRSIIAGNHPLTDFPDASMAVVTLNKRKRLTAYRNGERPLWYTSIPRGYVFTSTQDIAHRAGIVSLEKGPPSRCEAYTEYTMVYYGIPCLFASREHAIENVKEDLQCA